MTVSGSAITVLRDGADVFGGAVTGGFLTAGTGALYSWGNTDANFDNVVVTEIPTTTQGTWGGAGDDLFVFGNGGGDDTITDFVAGAGTDDVLDFSNHSLANSSADLTITQQGDDALIEFGTEEQNARFLPQLILR